VDSSCHHRKYAVAFLSGSPQQPLAEFVAADDYGGRWMYSAGDVLPEVCQEHSGYRSTAGGLSIPALGTRSSASPTISSSAMYEANRLPKQEESLSVVQLVQLAALVLDLRAQTHGPDKLRTVCLFPKRTLAVTIPSNQPQAVDPALDRFGFLERELWVRFDLHLDPLLSDSNADRETEVSPLLRPVC